VNGCELLSSLSRGFDSYTLHTMKKFLIIPLIAIGFFAFSNAAHADTLLGTQTDSSSNTTHIDVNSGGSGQTSGDGYIAVTTAGTVTYAEFYISQYYAETSYVLFAHITGGAIAGECQLITDSIPSNPGGYADLGAVAFNYSAGDCALDPEVSFYDVEIGASSNGGGNQAATIKLAMVGGTGTSYKYNIFGTAIDPENPGGTFSLVDFSPSLQGRTLRDFPYYGVRYTVSNDMSTSPWWITVEVATSTENIGVHNVQTSQVNVFARGPRIQNLVKDALDNGDYFYRVSLSTTSSTDDIFASTQGFFGINASSTDFIYSVDPLNPHLVNGLEDTQTDINDAATELDCEQYEFIDGFWFAESAATRVSCEIQKITYGIFAFLFVPSDSAITELSNAWTGMQDVFPFSVPFSVINAAEGGIETASSTVGTYELRFDSDVMGIHVPILTSTTLVDGLTTEHCDSSCANERKATYFATMSYIIWIAAAIGAFKMIT